MTGQSGEDNMGTTLIHEYTGGASEGKWTLLGEARCRKYS